MIIDCRILGTHQVRPVRSLCVIQITVHAVNDGGYRTSVRQSSVTVRHSKSPPSGTVTTAIRRRQLIAFSKPFDKRLICAARRLRCALLSTVLFLLPIYLQACRSASASTTTSVARNRSAIPRVFNQTYSDRPEAPVLAIVRRKVPRSWPGSGHFGRPIAYVEFELNGQEQRVVMGASASLLSYREPQ